MTKLRILALALSSSVLFFLGLPNELFHYGFPLLGYLALVPLYCAVRFSPSHGFTFLVVGLYGALHHAMSSYWLYFFKDFAFWTIGTTTIAYFVIYGVFGFYLAFLMKNAGRYRPLAFALMWTSFEYLKSIGFLGYPWGLLPYTQTTVLPLLQIADTTGLYGLSFILAFANASLAELLDGWTGRAPLPFRSSDWRAWGSVDRDRLLGGRNRGLSLSLRVSYVAFALLLLGSDLGYGLFRLASSAAPTRTINALVVQQNIDPWREGEEAAIAVNIALARKALEMAEVKPDLILFSESSLSRPYQEFRRWFEQRPLGDPLIPFIKESGSYLLTGAPIVLDWKDFKATNSVILIDPKGRMVADYAKVHPVPFAEAIPFWEYEGFRRFMQETVGLESGWVMGTEYKLFELPTPAGTVKFGAPICFEDAFPEVCREFARRGAELLVNLTNDSWSKTISAEVQHFAAARFRSIEFRIPLLRSTNGGVSCLVGPKGEVQEILPLFTTTARMISIPLGDPRPTVYARFGDWFPRFCLLLSALWSLILMREELQVRRKRV